MEVRGVCSLTNNGGGMGYSPHRGAEVPSEMKAHKPTRFQQAGG